MAGVRDNTYVGLTACGRCDAVIALAYRTRLRLEPEGAGAMKLTVELVGEPELLSGCQHAEAAFAVLEQGDGECS